MIRYSIIILLMFTSLALSSGLKLYRIERPEKAILDRVEKEDGRVSRYIPGLFAEVYLSDNQVAYLREKGYSPIYITEEEKPVHVLHPTTSIGTVYHSYEGVLQILDSLASQYPEICLYRNIGYTEEGRQIPVIKITDNPQTEEAEPELKLIGAMHGNELISQELLLHLVDDLLSNYDQDERITRLVDSTEIWILPNMNFDGAALNQRFNVNGVDLNRDFPDREFDTVSDTTGREAETIAVMEWSSAHHFALSANFHSGALVVNYPWDKNIFGAGYAATPDDRTFRRIALAYSSQNSAMYNSPHFNQGITNGALWYETSGSMQDWNYNWLGCLEVTVEISEIKQPEPSVINEIWWDNRASILSYLEQIFSGIWGTVRDSVTGNPVFATISIVDIDNTTRSDPDLGDFYRLLEPGTYDLRLESKGYHGLIVADVKVPDAGRTLLDLYMVPETKHMFRATFTDEQTETYLEDVTAYFYRKGSVYDSASSDMNGEISLELSEDSYHVEFIREEYFVLTDTVTLNRNISRDYALTRVMPGVVRGQVSSSVYSKASGAVVYCNGRTDTVGSDNQFYIEGIYPGHINVFAHLFQHKTTHLDTFLENGDSLTLALLLEQGSNEYVFDFEQSEYQFSGSRDWEKGIPITGPASAHSGSQLWATGLDRDYGNGPAVNYLETPIFSVLDLSFPMLEYYQWYSTEEFYDGGNIKLSVDEGKNWQVITPENGYPFSALSEEFGNPLGGEAGFSGKRESWEKVEVDLTPYAAHPFMMFRFDFGVDGEKGASGWYIDDVRIIDGNATALRTTDLESSGVEMIVYPNPANPGAKISIRVNGKDRTEVAIYNILGQQIRSKLPLHTNSGYTVWDWDGRSDAGVPVGSGIYFVKLKLGKSHIVKKVIILQ